MSPTPRPGRAPGGQRHRRVGRWRCVWGVTRPPVGRLRGAGATSDRLVAPRLLRASLVLTSPACGPTPHPKWSRGRARRPGATSAEPARAVGHERLGLGQRVEEPDARGPGGRRWRRTRCSPCRGRCSTMIRRPSRTWSVTRRRARRRGRGRRRDGLLSPRPPPTPVSARRRAARTMPSTSSTALPVSSAGLAGVGRDHERRGGAGARGRRRRRLRRAGGGPSTRRAPGRRPGWGACPAAAHRADGGHGGRRRQHPGLHRRHGQVRQHGVDLQRRRSRGRRRATPRTSAVFCAVTAVTTLVPNTPRAAKVFRSAWSPAPPPESEPAIVMATGGSTAAA